MRNFQPTIRRARKLRQDMSLPEAVLWDCLRAGKLHGLRFRRQHAVGPYLLDFYCAPARLAVEIDGAHHEHQAHIIADRRRDAWLAERGIRTVRFAATDVLNDDALDGVLIMIAEAAMPPPPPPSAVPLPRFAGEDQP